MPYTFALLISSIAGFVRSDLSLVAGGLSDVPPDRRTLRDIRSAYQGMKDYQYQTGQFVQWFRFDVADTTSDPVYGTGPQRQWYPAVTVPVMLGEYQRAPKNFDDDGLYLVDQGHLIISYFAFFSSTIVDPDPTGQNHLNDRVGFDGHLFSVASFLPRGRVADYFLTISVDLIEVAQEELIEDVVPSMFQPYIVAS